MPERICCKPDCANVVKDRHLKCGTCRSRDGIASNPACSVDGCDRQSKARGWCRTHYGRWLVDGATGGPIRHREASWSDVQCRVTECDRAAQKRGWCGTHYNVWLKRGYEPTAAVNADGRFEVVGYYGMHARLARYLGPAKEHACADCGMSASHWSYDHKDADELVDPVSELPYSMRLDHYDARCVPCHKRFDLMVA